jgi:diaminopimelate decarboxylase
VKHAIEGKNYQVHYALKANVNKVILGEVLQAGFGADCVSGNEVKRALEVGFSPRHVVFAGVGKTDKEILYGLEHDIFSFNVESIEELKVIDELAGSVGKSANVALRINPNVDAKTHAYITTGTRDNKFGITVNELWEALELLSKLRNISFIGIHFHIGSQITDNSRFKILSEKINELHQVIREKGFKIPHVNVGGGLGINYSDPDAQPIVDFDSYFQQFNKYLELQSGQTLHFELGRSIVGQCGSLISKVLYTKPGQETTFMIIDAGMTELIRPALYGTPHLIENLSRKDGESIYDVVGPICETTDAFARGLSFPKTKRGDLVAIRSCGAYAEVMSSRYNLRDVAPSVFSNQLA